MGYVDLGIKLLGWVITAIEGGGAFLDTIKGAHQALVDKHAAGESMTAEDVHNVVLSAQAINADTQTENPSTHEGFKP